jgi:hypothetical protein
VAWVLLREDLAEEDQLELVEMEELHYLHNQVLRIAEQFVGVTQLPDNLVALVSEVGSSIGLTQLLVCQLFVLGFYRLHHSYVAIINSNGVTWRLVRC